MAKKNTNQGDERLENVDEALSKTELWIQNNQKILWIILGCLVVAAVGYFLYTWHNKTRNEDAKNESFVSEINFEEQASKAVDYASYYVENQNYAVALNGDGENKGFLDIVDQYCSTKAGKLAAYYAGLCYLKQGDYNNAITYFKKYTNDDKIFAPMALGLIGDCYLQLGDQQNAVSYYEKAVKKSDNDFTAPMFMTKLAMTYEIMDNNAKALETYKAMKKEYPSSDKDLDVSRSIAILEQKMK